jgi:L-ascorbate metabolism protein UlaG (beta-lactamase superfamily)
MDTTPHPEHIAAASAPRVTYVGHGTVLIEMDGVRIMTDPLLRRWRGPLLRRGPLPDGAALRDLDAVLISHLHIDHLDVASLRLLSGDPVIIVPEHGVAHLRGRGFEKVVGMVRGAEHAVGPLRVTATEADHSGRRTSTDGAREALGFVVNGPCSVYVAGDTGLFPGMSDLGAGLDVACLPVDGWGPRLPDDHLSSLTAAQALTMLEPRIAVPIHWGTYYPPGLAEVWRGRKTQPPRVFACHAARLAPQVEVRVLEPGAGFEVPPATPDPDLQA